MSFRVRPTHNLLMPETPQPQDEKKTKYGTLPKSTSSSLTSSSVSKTSSSSVSTAVNRPTDSSTKGMAIRVVTTGQPDHM